MSEWSASQIQTWPLERLVPYAKNARTHSPAQIAQVAASIREFGFVNPILASADGTLIAGHGRLAAAQKLGLPSVPVILLDHLSETQRKALVIADNKLSENAGWDRDLLALEIAELKVEGFDLDLVGFDPEELGSLLDDAAPESQVDPDEVEPPRHTPISQPGDVWVCSNHRVMCGDATSLEAIETLMQGKLADLWLTDPPYNVGYAGESKPRLPIANDRMADGDFRQFLRDAIREADGVRFNDISTQD